MTIWWGINSIEVGKKLKTQNYLSSKNVRIKIREEWLKNSQNWYRWYKWYRNDRFSRCWAQFVFVFLYICIYKSCFAAGIIGLLRCMCQGSWVGESLGSIRTYKTTIFHTSKAKRLIQSVCVCVCVFVTMCMCECVCDLSNYCQTVGTAHTTQIMLSYIKIFNWIARDL